MADPDPQPCPLCDADADQVECLVDTRTHWGFFCAACGRMWRRYKSNEEKEADRDVAD